MCRSEKNVSNGSVCNEGVTRRKLTPPEPFEKLLSAFQSESYPLSTSGIALNGSDFKGRFQTAAGSRDGLIADCGQIKVARNYRGTKRAQLPPSHPPNGSFRQCVVCMAV